MNIIKKIKKKMKNYKKFWKVYLKKLYLLKKLMMINFQKVSLNQKNKYFLNKTKLFKPKVLKISLSYLLLLIWN